MGAAQRTQARSARARARACSARAHAGNFIRRKDALQNASLRFNSWFSAQMCRLPGSYSYGLYGYGLYSYGLYSYGLYSYGLYSYGLYRADVQTPRWVAIITD